MCIRDRDNRSHEEAEWDMELLPLELEDLKSLEFDLGLTGFDEHELGRLLLSGHVGLTDENAVLPVPENPISKLGDAWILGTHRVLCGDCTDAATVAKCLNGVRPHLMVTDPPYGCLLYTSDAADERSS